MSTNYPTSQDTFNDPESGDTLNSANHFGMHVDLNDAIEAIEAKVGISGSTDQNSLDYHKNSTSNPHSVTKTQVSLGNCDNTSDANKPVSTNQQTALNLKANIAQEAWHSVGAAGEPAYENGWSSYTADAWGGAKFMKDSLGFVHLIGLAQKTNSPLNQIIFTLPVGYRPAGNATSGLLLTAFSGETECRLDINGNGGIKKVVGTTTDTWVSLAGITFKAEQ